MNSVHSSLRIPALLIVVAVQLAVVCAAQVAAVPASPTRPPIVGVAHIGLKTDDMAAARQFYTGLLGFHAFASSGIL